MHFPDKIILSEFGYARGLVLSRRILYTLITLNAPKVPIISTSTVIKINIIQFDIIMSISTDDYNSGNEYMLKLSKLHFQYNISRKY